jgi:hypothetical protein
VRPNSRGLGCFLWCGWVDKSGLTRSNWLRSSPVVAHLFLEAGEGKSSKKSPGGAWSGTPEAGPFIQRRCAMNQDTRSQSKNTRNSEKLGSVEHADPDIGVPLFPLDVLPGPARRLVEESARSLGCAPDLIAVPLLAVLGAAIGTRWCLEVKPGWLEYGNIYAAVVADPGSAKSPAQHFATQPLHYAQKPVDEQRRAEIMEAQPQWQKRNAEM